MFPKRLLFGLFRFLLMAILSKMHEDPFFFKPSTLNIGTKYNITVEQRQLAFNYGMRNLEHRNDGKEENDGMLVVLRIETIKYPAVVLTTRSKI